MFVHYTTALYNPEYTLTYTRARKISLSFNSDRPHAHTTHKQHQWHNMSNTYTRPLPYFLRVFVRVRVCACIFLTHKQTHQHAILWGVRNISSPLNCFNIRDCWRVYNVLISNLSVQIRLCDLCLSRVPSFQENSALRGIVVGGTGISTDVGQQWIFGSWQAIKQHV